MIQEHTSPTIRLSSESVEISTACIRSTVEFSRTETSFDTAWDEIESSRQTVSSFLSGFALSGIDSVQEDCDIESVDSLEFVDVESEIARREATDVGRAKMADARRWARHALYPSSFRSIKILRMEKGLSQKQLADALGTDQAAISRWENAPSNLQASTIKKLALVFGISSADMWAVAESMLEDGAEYA